MTRVYCWPTGNVFELNAEGVCPECAPYGGANKDGHRVVEGDECGAWSGCTRTHLGEGLSDYDRYDHGHPCELPRRHEGSCDCPAAREECGHASEG